MSFTGAISHQWHSLIRDVAISSKGSPLYVPCSGNFTIERIAWAEGHRDLHGNDVSLYSCIVGKNAAGEGYNLQLKGDFEFVKERHLVEGLDAFATVSLIFEMLNYGDNVHSGAIKKEYARQWDTLHKKTKEKCGQSFRLKSFFAGDLREFIKNGNHEGTCVSYPPTYKAGYEKMYKRLHAAFIWDAPEFGEFNPEDPRQMTELLGDISEYRRWLVFSDQALDAPVVGMVQATARAKPVYAYGNIAAHFLRRHRTKCDDYGLPVHYGPVEECPEVKKISGRTFELFRQTYLAKSITPGPARSCFAVVTGGNRLLGAFAIDTARFEWCDIYLLSDFCIRPSAHRRLSKLILVCILSKEFRGYIEGVELKDVLRIGTSAFTDKPVSMKYRGIFDLHKRIPGALNYVGAMGRWSLKEGFEWWRKKHASK